MANLSGQPYPERQFNLSGLNGITDKQLEQHYKLYAGYVANTNKLNEQLAELIKAGDTMSPKFGELTRRMGFEYNGMRLHEYYFENRSLKLDLVILARTGLRVFTGDGAH